MKDYTPSAIRNVCFIGHGSSGKTTICEALLHSLKAIDRMGSVDEGSTHSDFMKEEIERGHSIGASLLTAATKDIKYNFIDTPGFSDFLGETKGALHVSDFSILAIHGVAGVEVVTEQVWDFAGDGNTPRAFFINLLDKENADFDNISSSLEETFGNTVIVQYAVNPGTSFNQIIDLISMKLITYDKGTAAVSDIPANLQGKADELRETLVERAAEADDELLEKYFEEGELSVDEIKNGLKTGINNGECFPILCGAALSKTGIDLLANFIADFAPSPVDRPNVISTDSKSGDEVELTPDPTGPTALLIFKTTSEAHVGEMSFFRVYSGTVKSGDELQNATSDGNEKISQISISMGKTRTPTDHIGSGDMGVFVKLRGTSTGDTLAAGNKPIMIQPPKFPEASIRAAVVSKSGGEDDKVAEGLNILKKSDPTFSVGYDPELQQTIISGQGEAQFIVVLSKLLERFGVEAELIEPRIPYRETIRSKAEAEGKHKKQSGGRGQFGISWIRVEPLKRGEGYEFVDEIVGGVIPRQFIPAVDKGIKETLQRGVIAGYQVVDIRATVFDGKHHNVDSDEHSFKMAGSVGFREAVKKTKTAILEPIYEIEVKVPQDNMGDVMGDVSSRRGKVLNMGSEGKWQIINAHIPLAELYKYANTLRSMTSGRGMHRRKFSHYEEVPGDIQKRLVKEYQERRAEASA
ncbi:MAG: elongation factor G [Candidatus Electryonea clarkiae]|nr:elongation factor G [Candidatus Electryonea clarkiae]MDP8285730.1 elongation factor G [Candidatus Electryonea clarkiae]